MEVELGWDVDPVLGFDWHDIVRGQKADVVLAEPKSPEVPAQVVIAVIAVAEVRVMPLGIRERGR